MSEYASLSGASISSMTPSVYRSRRTLRAMPLELGLVAISRQLQLHQHRVSSVALDARDVDQERLGPIHGHEGLDLGPNREERAVVTDQSRGEVSEVDLGDSGVRGPAGIGLELLNERRELAARVIEYDHRALLQQFARDFGSGSSGRDGSSVTLEYCTSPDG